MKYLIFLNFLALFFFVLLPKIGYTQSVTLANITTPVIGGGPTCSDAATSNCKDLVTDVNDGSSDNPHIVYVPIYNENSDAGPGGNHFYSLLWGGSGDGTSDMPSYDDSSSANSGNIVTQLTINSGSSQSSQILYAGILNEDGNKFVVYDNNSAGENDGFISYASSESVNVNVTLNINKLCSDTFGDTCTAKLRASVTPTNDAEVTILYFLSENNYKSTSTEQDLSSQNGVLVKYRFSNKVYHEDDRVTSFSLKKGDRRITADYTLDLITEPYKLIALRQTGSFSGGTYSTASSDVLSTDFSPGEGGELDIFPLVNGTDYHITLGYVDKWQFVSKLPGSKNEKPESIINFLEKESCYFISAGFKEKHYILEYFRQFRDHFLLKFSLGQAFVNFYYETAPYYALKYIYPSETLSFLVKSFAYIIYFFMTRIWYFVAAFFLITIYSVAKKRSWKKMTSW
ncbi:MAG: hypothetical protein VXY34_05540 [Bdellovibrionota bacterium]|nr:hypothetical protein [Bdellovibrionota bacterium]